MDRYLQKGIAIGFLLLLILWVAGLFRTTTPPATSEPPITFNLGRETSAVQQVANNLRQIGLELGGLALLDKADVERIHVHEKSAWLTSRTAAFEEDEKQIRWIVKGKGTVFNELASGVPGQRRLNLMIGVNPERFDALVDQLRTVGKLESVTVQLRDRTAEFRKLHAKRQSLTQHREAVAKLRQGRGSASFADDLRVAQQVHEIEEKLQQLGVQLGELLGKESFYQVNLTLSEYQPAKTLDRLDGVPRYMLGALMWALPWWFAVMAVFAILPAAYHSIRTLLTRGET